VTATKNPERKLRLARVATAIAALLLVGLTAQGALADGDPGAGTTPSPLTPSITTDQADYPPGSTVTLTGAGWQPTESVHVFVNDTLGKTWQYSADVVADLGGGFTLQFDLPNTFISNYDVTATGTWNDEATTGFTDGNATSVSGTVTDSVTNNPIAGVTVACDTTGGCNNAFTTTTDASGIYRFDQTTSKLAFATNGPVTLTLRFTKAGYTTGTIAISNVSNSNSFASENIALTPTAQSQTITFAQPPTPQSFSATFNVNPTASSGLPVTVTAHAGSVCTVASAATGFDVTMTASSGSCTLDANQAGNSAFSAATTVSRTVDAQKASSTSTVTCPASVVYTGNAQTPCTALVTGAGGLSQSLTVTYSNNTNAGTATAGASFGGDANHASSNGSKTFTIAKAASTTTVTCPGGPYTYTGAAQEPCSAEATGAGNLDEILAVSYSDNIDAGLATASASYPGDTNHESSSGGATFAIGQAHATVEITWSDATYTGSPHAATAHVTGVAPEDLGAASSLTYYPGSNASSTALAGAPTDAGTYTVEADFNGTTNYGAASATKTITIDKADSTTAVTCPPGPYTYTGSAHEPCSAEATGAGSLEETLTVSYKDNTDAGTGTASASYPGDDNHKPSSGSDTFTIDKADSSTAVTCSPGPYTYTGSAHEPCSAEATGAGNLDEILTVSYSDNTDAGLATASASYSGDDNHKPSSDSTHFTIDRAHPTVTITWSDTTYSGSPHPATAHVTGVGSPAQDLGAASSLTYYPGTDTAGTALADAPTDAGTYTVDAGFDGNANYEPASKTKTITIDKADSSTTATCPPGSYTYNGSAQTPCTVTVIGAGGLDLTPDPDYANNTNAGTATASYSYPGDANHKPSSDSDTFTIGKADSITTVTCPAGPYTYTGSAHEPCSVSVIGAGSLDLTTDPDYAGNTNAGEATASYTYAGDGNHKPSSDSKHFTIDRATPTVSATWSDWTFDGTAHAASGSVSGVGSPAASLGSPDSFAYYSGSTASGPALPDAPTDAGTYTVVAHYNGSANYTPANSAPKTVTVAKATPTVTIMWTTPQTYNGNTHPATASVTGVGSPAANLGPANTLTYYSGSTASGTALAGAPTDAGTYTVQADFNETPNYLSKSATATITIAKAGSTTLVTCPTSVNYTATAQMPCTAAASGAGGLSQALTVSYSNNTAVGIAGASATFAGDANHDGSNDSESFKIVYGAGEVQFLQPINGTAHNLGTNPDVSTFKSGSTIPVKVQVKLPNGTIVHPASATWLTPQKGTATSQPVDETVYSDPATSGASFSWDSSGQFHQYNWGTPKTGGGFYYLIGVKLDDDQTYTVYISLR